MFKKILLSFLTSIILFQGSLATAYAQTARWYNQRPNEWFTKVYGDLSGPEEIFGERYTAAQVQWVLYSLIAVPINLVFDNERLTACVFQGLDSRNIPLTGTCLNAELLVQMAESFLSLMNWTAMAPSNYNPVFADNKNGLDLLSSILRQDRPLSGLTYFKNVVMELNPVQEAYAQFEGYGYTHLGSLQAMWSASRDISYGLLIFIVIILSLMIMFRTKISPQTVITAQSAIPKIFIAAILITFSYAIAGFLIDMVYVVIGLVSTVLAPVVNTTDPTKMYLFLTNGPNNTGVLGLMVSYVVAMSLAFIVALVQNPVLQSLGSLPQVVGIISIILILVLLVIAVVLIFATVRIIIMLARTLVNVYLLVIAAPLYILIGVVNQSMSFGNWVKAMISNLLVFVATGVMFLFAYLFLGYAILTAFANYQTVLQNAQGWLTNTLGGTIDIPSEASGWSPPLLNMGGSAASTALIFAIVSLSVLLLIPKIADMIKSFFSGRPFAYGTAIGEAVTAAAVGSSAIAKYGSGAQKAIRERLRPVPTDLAKK